MISAHPGRVSAAQIYLGARDDTHSLPAHEVVANVSDAAAQLSGADSAAAQPPIHPERPWVVAGRDARSLVAGSKTSHRWPVQVPADMKVPDGCSWPQDISDDPGATWTVYRRNGNVRRWSHSMTCPLGDAGTLLWLQEAWRLVDRGRGRQVLQWRAEGAAKQSARAGAWQRAEVQPRQYTRLLLAITSIEIRRLQSLTPDEARCEGFDSCSLMREHWDHRHPEGARWVDDPWVWVASLRPVWERFPRPGAQQARRQGVQWELDLG